MFIRKELKVVALVWPLIGLSIFFVLTSIDGIGASLGASVIPFLKAFVPSIGVYETMFDQLHSAYAIIFFSLTCPIFYPSYIDYVIKHKEKLKSKQFKYLMCVLPFASIAVIFIGVDFSTGSSVGFSRLFLAVSSWGFVGCILYFLLWFHLLMVSSVFLYFRFKRAL